MQDYKGILMKKKVPFDLTRATEIGKYVAYYIDQFRKNSNANTEAIVLKKLKVVFSLDFEGYLKVVNGKHFAPAFFQKIGKRRSDTFKYLLCKISNKYREFDYGIK